jgi:hypothetical protein
MAWFPTIISTLLSLHAAVTDSTGVLRQPLLPNGKVTTVLIFVAVDCPISNGYAPELKRICADYRAQNVRFDLVYADPAVTAAEVRKHVADYGYDCPALLDRKGVLAGIAGATVTPAVAVFDARGTRVYHGRIDDLYADFGKKKYAPTTHELRTVLDDLAAGRPVKTLPAAAVGCPI